MDADALAGDDSDVGSLGTHFDLPDPRGHSRFLRLSWHAARRVIVVSHWRDGKCVSSTPIGIPEIGQLLTFLVDVLRDAALNPSVSATSSEPSRPMRVLARLRDWLRPRLAPVVAIVPRGDQSSSSHATERREEALRSGFGA
jgi:hypothetical protein